MLESILTLNKCSVPTLLRLSLAGQEPTNPQFWRGAAAPHDGLSRLTYRGEVLRGARGGSQNRGPIPPQLKAQMPPPLNLPSRSKGLPLLAAICSVTQ